MSPSRKPRKRKSSTTLSITESEWLEANAERKRCWNDLKPRGVSFERGDRMVTRYHPRGYKGALKLTFFVVCAGSVYRRDVSLAASLSYEPRTRVIACRTEDETRALVAAHL